VQSDVARHLPDARITTMTGAGHLMPFERPAECAEIVLAMLSDTPYAGS
jgi:pimeloyl-ACP methyl ester carboxylesterase